MKNNDNKLTMFKVTVYKPDGTTIFDPEWKEVKKDQEGIVTIEETNLQKGYICHVTVEVYKKEVDTNPAYRGTTVITII